ncbi:valine--tRNA ligase [Candidatus Saccharibacteria bacterium]|nr:valine--tRNA ligase [Candidatus Saccharibacteria bacterium]
MKFASAYEPENFETDIYAAWESADEFLPGGKVGADKLLFDGNKNNDPKTYSIVMPPPNANGNLHIGHGLTIALEDSLTRYHRLRGEMTWYIPGADHAGFETWVVYERVLEAAGHTRFEYSRDELYAQVWDFVQEQRGNMELQVRALGASCSWKDLTFTLDENVVRRVYKTFEKMWNDGMIYRGEKLVNYCTKHQTAFADIEVEHKDEKGKLWDIAYPYNGGEIIVSTTRPETLFGDVAVAVPVGDKRYKDLVGKTVWLPLTNREIPVIEDEHADPEYGTGAVKITPAHDNDDFEVGERHDLPRIQVIGFDGKMLPVCGPDYEGLTTAECRKKVLKDLDEKGLLRGEKEIVHAVAHCYKCDTVIEPMLKEQWFVDVEKLASVAIAHLEADEIKFYPSNKKNVLINYLKGLKDWNISRQIPWGIAIPMFKSEDGEWIFDSRTNLTEIEVGGKRYIRDEDTFDTWFSSSHWPIVCTDWEEGKVNPYYPLNVMETGADILFAWVARMIMMGLYVTGEVPFKEVYLHGLVLDAHGAKMSKSKGNVINPMDLVAKYGSDAFRLGILRGRSAGMNQAFSEQSVVAGRNLCNKLWNISRFIQEIVEGADSDVSLSGSPAPQKMSYAGESDGSDSRQEYTFSASQVEKDQSPEKRNIELSALTLNPGEDWICREINQAKWQVESQMKNYRFSEAVETLYSLIWDKYADWFIETEKIYRNAGLLKMTLEAILKILHPFAPFVTEAIWQNLSWTEGLLISQKWPSDFEFDPISAENFEKLMDIVSTTRSALQALSEAHKGFSKTATTMLYGDDSLVDDNQVLVQKLAGVSAVISTEGQPRGLRLPIANHEVYLDISAEIVSDYAKALENKILSVGRELDSLNMRMMNPNYVDKAPAELVNETRKLIAEKEELIARLKAEREAI